MARKSAIIITLTLKFLNASIGVVSGQTYDFNHPDTVWQLPNELIEISGLGFSTGDEWLLANQDEQGHIYAIHPENGKVAKSWPIAKDGDYEGIEMVDSVLYLLRSDGKLYTQTWQDGPVGELKDSKMGFMKGSDVEGLAWHPKHRHMLVAVKDEPDQGPEGPKGWYTYDLVTSIRDTVLMGIDRATFREAIGQHVPKKQRKRLYSWLDNRMDLFLLGPSTLAVHPHTYDIYLISSRGKVLLVFDENGKFLKLYALSPQQHIQPEGMAFNQQGDLFIASEGKKNKPARIAVYRLKPSSVENPEQITE